MDDVLKKMNTIIEEARQLSRAVLAPMAERDLVKTVSWIARDNPAAAQESIECTVIYGRPLYCKGFSWFWQGGFAVIYPACLRGL